MRSREAIATRHLRHGSGARKASATRGSGCETRAMLDIASACDLDPRRVADTLSHRRRFVVASERHTRRFRSIAFTKPGHGSATASARGDELDAEPWCDRLRVMKPTPWIAVLVGVCLLFWTPLAYGTPPDPGWISGLWDEGDHDDVAELAASLAATPSVHTGGGAPSVIVVTFLGQRDPGTPLPVRLPAASPRAPPAA